MKILELFAGTRSIGKAFEAKGHEVFSVEWDKDFENIDLYADINTITAEDILQKFGRPDVIWASPDCSTFSIAAISHHRRKNQETGNLDPVSDYAKFCDEVDQHVLQLIKELNPQFYFIENPRGGMRKMTWMQGLPRYTVTYCQYGDKRMKPTDIWTNHPDPQFKPMCKNGDPCHEKAPRGSKTGTQGLKGSKERSVIPEALCQHIVEICEKHINTKKEKEMELKIYSPTEDGFIKAIEWNHEEIKKEVAEKVSYYANLVYTDDQIKEAKSDRVKLNKFVQALESKRKEVKKQCLAPYEEFEKKMKEIIQIVTEPICLIDGQIKSYDEQKKAEKLDLINKYWNSVVSPDHPLKLERVMDLKWLNATVSMKSIQEAINEILAKYAEDVATLQKLPEFSFAAIETYKSTLDLNKALNEAHRLSEMAKREAEAEKLEAERKVEQERKKAEAEFAKCMNPPVEEQLEGQISFNDAESFEKCIPKPAKEKGEWISFSALLTTEDALALKAFFESRNIEFIAI